MTDRERALMFDVDRMVAHTAAIYEELAGGAAAP